MQAMNIRVDIDLENRWINSGQDLELQRSVWYGY